MLPPRSSGTRIDRIVVVHIAYVAANMQSCAHFWGCPSCCKALMRAARNKMESMGANSTVVAAAFITPTTVGNSVPVNSSYVRHAAMTSWVVKNTTAKIIVHITAGAGGGS